MQMGIFPHASLVLGLHPRPPHRRGVQLVVGRAAHDHLEAAASHAQPSLAFARTALRTPPLAKRVPDRDRRLGALHRRAPPGAALARPGRLGRRPRAPRRTRPARGRHAASRAASGSASASPSSGSSSSRSRSPAVRAAAAAGSWIAVAALVRRLVRRGRALRSARLAPLLAPGAGFGLAAGVTYAAADVGTKAAVHGGALVLFAAAGLGLPRARLRPDPVLVPARPRARDRRALVVLHERAPDRRGPR